MGHSRASQAEAAHSLIAQGRFTDALAAFDALVDHRDLPLSAYCNALWVVQNDNTKLPIDAARSRRYLAASLPYAAGNPPIHLNAAGVLMELAQPDEAITQLLLARQAGVDLRPYHGERLFRPLLAHPRWPEVIGEEAPNISAPSPLEQAYAAVARGDRSHAFFGLHAAWRRTRAPRLADLLDALASSEGKRTGYAADWFEQVLRDNPEELTERADHCTRISRDGKGGYTERDGKTAFWLIEDCEDPRFVTAVLALLASPPIAKVRMRVQQAYALALETLAAVGDKRAIEPLRAVAERYPALMPTPLGEWLRTEILKTADALAVQRDAEPLSEADAGLCATIERALPGSGAAAKANAKVGDGEPRGTYAAGHRAAAAGSDSDQQALLELWQRTGSPRAADLLDCLDQRARTGVAPRRRRRRRKPGSGWPS